MRHFALELTELAAIEAESIASQPLANGAHLHLGNPVQVVGVPDAGMMEMGVFLVE